MPPKIIDLKNFKIDKQCKHIAYNDYSHVYVNLNTGEQYSSVTTLIGMYKKPFDRDLHSQTKAIELIVGTEQFTDLKKQFGYNNVLKYYNENVATTIEKKHELAQATQEILNKWTTLNTQAVDKGKAYHKEKEDFYTSKFKVLYESLVYQVCLDNELNNGIDYAIYPEMLVFNDEYKIAGQIDLVIKQKNKIIVRDYKTNKKLDLRNTFKDGKMLFPIQDIEDCNYRHYQIQLSMYAFMIKELFGLEIDSLYIDHHVPEGDKPYKVDYIESHVINMLDDFKFIKDFNAFKK